MPYVCSLEKVLLRSPLAPYLIYRYSFRILLELIVLYSSAFPQFLFDFALSIKTLV